jgi:hypothetical protein
MTMISTDTRLQAIHNYYTVAFNIDHIITLLYRLWVHLTLQDNYMTVYIICIWVGRPIVIN